MLQNLRLSEIKTNKYVIYILPNNYIYITTLFKDEECMLEIRVFFREIDFTKKFREIDYTENLRLPEDQYLGVL